MVDGLVITHKYARKAEEGDREGRPYGVPATMWVITSGWALVIVQRLD
jgi:hypothetical protein